jgi:hypothetical protein
MAPPMRRFAPPPPEGSIALGRPCGAHLIPPMRRFAPPPPEGAIALGRPSGAYLNHSRIVSHARPKMFAAGTSASATSGNSASVLPSSAMFTVPTLCPWTIGATSGSFAVLVSYNAGALSFGTVRYWSAKKPAATASCAPFQTRSVSTVAPD